MKGVVCAEQLRAQSVAIVRKNSETGRVRANSEKIRTIFERICIELCRFMQNSRNANMVECENGFCLQKCCPCEARLGHLEIDTHGYLVNGFGVYLIIYCHPGMCDNVGRTFPPYQYK